MSDKADIAAAFLEIHKEATRQDWDLLDFAEVCFSMNAAMLKAEGYSKESFMEFVGQIWDHTRGRVKATDDPNSRVTIVERDQ